MSQDEPTFHNATTEQPTPLKTQPDILPLKVRIAHVNRSQVDAKWRVLDESSQQQITAMLDLVETTCSSQADTLGFSRPRSTRNSYRRQHGIEVQQATQDLRSRIQNKLQTIPFPASKVNRKGSVPGVLKQTQTSEKEWGLEGLNDLKRNLQGQLTLAQHSVVLLDQETSRETAFLEQDLDSLRALEKNASRQQNSRNEAYRKLHPSLKTFRKENLDLTSPDVELHIAPSQPLNLEVSAKSPVDPFIRAESDLA